MWPAMYPPAGSSLQHAHQLQILSHQQLLRQQELYMIQQQAAQVMELQRSAQLVVSLGAARRSFSGDVFTDRSRWFDVAGTRSLIDEKLAPVLLLVAGSYP